MRIARPVVVLFQTSRCYPYAVPPTLLRSRWAPARRPGGLLTSAGVFERAIRELLRQSGIAQGAGRPAPDRRMWVGLDARGPSVPIRRVQAYVEVHVGEVRSLSELADVAGLSRAHFARRFHHETGEAPWAFVRRVRDAEAVRRLEAGDAPADVAYGSGYADQSHLTRSLRRRYGRTPGEVRSAGRDEREDEGGSTDVQDGAAAAD